MPEALFFQKSGKFLQRNSGAVVITLHLMAVLLTKKFHLLTPLGTLCDDLHAETMSHLDDHRADCGLLLVVGNIAHE